MTDGTQLRARAQILYRSLAPALTLAYIPRGPTVETDILTPFLERVIAHVRARGVFLLKIEPNWVRGDARESALSRLDAVRSVETIQPPVTSVLDLTADESTLLARMKPKWRYNIRLSEKKGVSVRAGTAADLDVIYGLMQTTGVRDNFAVHSRAYYATAFELLAAQDSVRLFIAEYKGQPLAAIFVTSFAREAIYLYGASGDAERNRMPNHALHWAAIRWAKERGCTRYDLWGIPPTTNEANDASELPSSLYQFKQGFGGRVVEYSGAWDVIFNPLLYRVYRLARRARRSSPAGGD
jgi:lipid II:glycine glycyltransferase (peptidoglycan interpeptide bridge formation enzyme)